MSKEKENNKYHINLKNNSSQNIYISPHHKNKSSNFISDSSPALISVQLYSSNSNQNSKKKEKNIIEKNFIKNIYNSYNLSYKKYNIKNEIKENSKKEEINLNNNFSNILINKNFNKKTSPNSNISKKCKRSNSSSSRYNELEQISFKKLKDYRIKFSQMCSNYSANTSKHISENYNLKGSFHGNATRNIQVKTNLMSGSQKMKKSSRKNSNEKKKMRTDNSSNSKNDFARYVNNDKYNFNGNILNMTNNSSKPKYNLPQSKSFKKVKKKNSMIMASNPNNKINKKRSNNINYINYNNYKNNFSKKKELAVLTKNNNTYRAINNKSDINNNINSFILKNVPTSPNSKNNYQSYFINIAKNNFVKKNSLSSKTVNKGNKNKSNGGNKSNKTSNSNINTTNYKDNENKNIYLMKPIQKRKKDSNEKNNEISVDNRENITNQSSFRSKNRKDNKNFLDTTNLSDIFNKNIENPEELHFFYIKILQNGNKISKKFEINGILI